MISRNKPRKTRSEMKWFWQSYVDNESLIGYLFKIWPFFVSAISKINMKGSIVLNSTRFFWKKLSINILQIKWIWHISCEKSSHILISLLLKLICGGKGCIIYLQCLTCSQYNQDYPCASYKVYVFYLRNILNLSL